MAKLHRMVKLNDRFDTYVFTFLLPPSVATVTSQDIFSKEFSYGHHRWTLSTVRGDQHLGAYLAMANVYDGMTCSVDFTMTLLNNDHYTKNETYVERGCVFSSQNPRLGRKSFIALTDLTMRGFQLPLGGDGGGWFLLELELRNCKSSFEQVHSPLILSNVTFLRLLTIVLLYNVNSVSIIRKSLRVSYARMTYLTLSICIINYCYHRPSPPRSHPKLCLIAYMYEALHDLMPDYISVLCTRVLDNRNTQGIGLTCTSATNLISSP